MQCNAQIREPRKAKIISLIHRAPILHSFTYCSPSLHYFPHAPLPYRHSPSTTSTPFRSQLIPALVVVFLKVVKAAHSSPSFLFSELDCGIASTRGHTKNFALKNQIYGEFSNSVACQVLIKQRALKKKKDFATLYSESFAQPVRKAQYLDPG